MIHMAYPWILLSLPLPLIRLWRRSQSDKSNERPIRLSTIAVQQLPVGQSSLSLANRKKWLTWLIWILLVISGSGLQWLGKPVELPRQGRNIMLAIDLSGSMRTPDMKVGSHYRTRLQEVKAVASQFIAKRINDRMGLILFGTKAYLQTPLTFDRKTVQSMLNDATVGLAGIQTAIGDGIGIAIKRLMNYPKQSKALILMTDGGNNAGQVDPMAAANEAKKLGIKIYTIGLGASHLTINTLFGQQVVNPSADLDIASLKKIAALTGGEYFRAEDGAALQAIYQRINQLEPVNTKSTSVRPTTPLYPYLLSLILLIISLSILLQQVPLRSRSK